MVTEEKLKSHSVGLELCCPEHWNQDTETPTTPRPASSSFLPGAHLLHKEASAFHGVYPKGLEPERGELEFLFFAFQKVVYSPGTVISPIVKRTIVRI